MSLSLIETWESGRARPGFGVFPVAAPSGCMRQDLVYLGGYMSWVCAPRAH